jgi:hypothetical protein
VFAYGAMSPAEVETKLKEAEAHRAEDELTRHWLQLQQEIAALREANPNRPPDDSLCKRLDDAEAAISARDMDKAAALLDEVRGMLDL